MKIGSGKAYEKVVFIGIAAVTILLMLGSLRFERNVSNQKLLYYQLQAIRTSVNLFKVVEKRNPQELIEMVKLEYSFPGEQQRRRYMEGPQLDREGRFIDAFGNPFFYDMMSGWVRSTTRGFEYW